MARLNGADMDERGRLQPLASCQQGFDQRRAPDGADGLIEEAQRLPIGPGAATVAQNKIGAGPHLRQVGGRDLDIDEIAGMAGVKIAEARHQPVGGQPHGAGDGQALVFVAGAGADFLDRVGDQIEAVAGGAGELLAGVGEPRRPGRAVDQDGANMVFQRL